MVAINFVFLNLNRLHNTKFILQPFRVSPNFSERPIFKKQNLIVSKMQTQEAEYFDSLFRMADRDRDGLVSRPECLDFIRRSKVNDLTLDRIYELVDRNENDYIDKAAFFLVLKLVSMAQQNEPLNIQRAYTYPKFPEFYGTSVESIGVSSISVASIGISSSYATVNTPIAPITLADFEKYDQLFQDADSNKDSFIDAEEGRIFFGKSGLPNEVLAYIWDLSDLKKRAGKLNKFQFRIAMHLIYMAIRRETLPQEISGAFMEEIYTSNPSRELPSPSFVSPSLPIPDPFYFGHPNLRKHQ